MINYEIPPDICEIQFDGLHRKLVALKDIMLGEVIVTLPLTTQCEPDMYSIEASPGVHIDCSQSLAGACNHSCKPNASVRHFRIIAWECIKAGDEITIDYRKTEYKLAVPFMCQCGYCDGKEIK
jgi:hypothetical protein